MASARAGLEAAQVLNEELINSQLFDCCQLPVPAPKLQGREISVLLKAHSSYMLFVLRDSSL